MTNRTSIIILFVLLSCATCFAQTSFQGLTPGQSTRADAEKILGVPRDVCDYGNVCSYSPPAGLKHVRVTYGDAKPDNIIDEFEIMLLTPVSRASLIKKFELPEKSDVQRFTSDNQLTELFGGKALIRVQYAGHDESTGIEWIIYYSRRDFQYLCSQGILKCGAAASNSPASNMTTGTNSTTTNRGEANQPSDIPSCFAGNPAVASTDRSAHYTWARQQSVESLDGHLRDKLDALFRCSSLNDDWLARVFADLSVYIANHVPTINCFNGDAGVLDRGESAHYHWAKSKSREEILKNLQWKVSAALRCLDREAQLNFYADVSLTIAHSGVERKHVRNVWPPIHERIADVTDTNL